jgi:hypothetical protein
MAARVGDYNGPEMALHVPKRGAASSPFAEQASVLISGTYTLGEDEAQQMRDLESCACA